MKKNREQAKIVQGSIGEAGCWNRMGETLFMDENLNSISLNFGGYVVNTVIELPKLLQENTLGCRSILKIIKHHPKITAVG